MAITPKPVEETMKLSDTKQQFSSVINRVAIGEANVIVEKSGLPVAVIVAVDEYRKMPVAEPEIQGEILYQLVEQGVFDLDDLSDDEVLDFSVFAVRQSRWQTAANELVKERTAARLALGEDGPERDTREAFVQAMREVRAAYIAAIARHQ
jgi:prevent-host-death family protein